MNAPSSALNALADLGTISLIQEQYADAKAFQRPIEVLRHQQPQLLTFRCHLTHLHAGIIRQQLWCMLLSLVIAKLIPSRLPFKSIRIDISQGVIQNKSIPIHRLWVRGASARPERINGGKPSLDARIVPCPKVIKSSFNVPFF